MMEQWQPIAATAMVTCPMLQAKYGIDTDRFFVIGVSLWIGERRDQATEVKKPYVSILAIDTLVVKAYGVDPIQRYIDGNDGVLPYVKIRIDATLEETLRNGD